MDETLMRKRKKAVIEAEKAWAQAHLEFDLDKLAALMASEYRRIDSQGNILNKTETLKTYADGPRKWQIARSTELAVTIFGPVASVIGLWHGKGHNKGVQFDYRARFLSVYVERAGQWLLAAEGSVPIPAGSEPADSRPVD